MQSKETLIQQRRQEWVSRYENGQTGWDRGDISPALSDWLMTGALQPCRILVPGCGWGYEVVALARLGFDVTAIDIVEEAVTHVKQQLSEHGCEAEVIQGDLLHWQPQEPFDAVYEQTCLCALNPALWQDYERCLHQWLQPGGHLFALFMQTGREGGPPFHCELSDMRALFDEERWRWPDYDGDRIPHPSGRHEQRLILERL